MARMETCEYNELKTKLALRCSWPTDGTLAGHPA